MVEDLYTEISYCRVCRSSDLKEIVSLGDHAITTFGSATEEPQRAPLDLVYCNACFVAQLRHTVRPDVLYSSYYWYRSGMNKTQRDHLHQVIRTLEKKAQVKAGDIVVSIGCNDGTELDAYETPGVLKVGYEPGPELAKVARRRGALVFNDFFRAAPYHRVFRQPAKAISAIAMFYDLDNPASFAEDLRRIMAPDSVALIEANDLHSMVVNGSFDFIGHEHLCYYTLRALEDLLLAADLKVFDAERSDWLGGSLTVWLCPVNARRQQSTRVRAEKEREAGLESKLAGFATGIVATATATRQFVEEEIERGGRVYVYGASTRGNTILQTAELNHELIAGAAEIHPEKIGKVLVGTGIPIVSEEEARRDATAFLVLPYAYRSEFLAREAKFLADGGRIAFPLPSFEVVQRG